MHIAQHVFWRRLVSGWAQSLNDRRNVRKGCCFFRSHNQVSVRFVSYRCNFRAVAFENINPRESPLIASRWQADKRITKRLLM